MSKIHKIQVISDIHFDVMPCPAPTLAKDADAVVVAGGTCAGAEKAFAYLRAAFPSPIPLVLVLGNEEFHGWYILEELTRARRLALDYDVLLLENTSIEAGGVRFVGATLWTGYDLDGPEGQAAAMAAAMRDMDDHRRIFLTRTPSRRFLPQQALERFGRSSAYIAKALGQPFEGPTVVVTHHAPSARSLDPGLGSDRLSNAFASRLDQLVEVGGADLWIHGHTQYSCDYLLGRTRVISNPQGYGGDNQAFDPALVIEVQR